MKTGTCFLILAALAAFTAAVPHSPATRDPLSRAIENPEVKHDEVHISGLSPPSSTGDVPKEEPVVHTAPVLLTSPTVGIGNNRRKRSHCFKCGGGGGGGGGGYGGGGGGYGGTPAKIIVVPVVTSGGYGNGGHGHSGYGGGGQKCPSGCGGGGGGYPSGGGYHGGQGGGGGGSGGSYSQSSASASAQSSSSSGNYNRW